MIGWRTGLVLSCCLLAATGTLSTVCRAQDQPQSSSASSDANTTKTQQSAPKPADVSPQAQPDSTDYDNSLGPHLLKSIAEDQKEIWTRPTRLQLSDADWLLPLGMAIGGTLATDTEVSKHLSNSPSRLNYSNDFSNYGLGAFVGADAGLYFWGRLTHDDHKREAGFLAGEAVINSLALSYAAKYTFERERPLTDDYRGRFWQGGGDSFPSVHSTVAWSLASVLAHEYPGPLTSLFAYGMASAIGASRVSAKQHFPTDVLVGSAIGWFVGQEVYRHHHDPELGGSDWQTYTESRDEKPGRSPSSVGSPYVELDSWIYPAIERLAALGYIHSAYLGMRPWTRIECAELIQEARDEIRDDASVSQEADHLYTALAEEFGGDLEKLSGANEASIKLESAYATTTTITGPPLHDSDHFGETIINDYGRPYEEGFNTYDGFSGYGTAGRFVIYIRGEYQESPSASAYPLAAREAIAIADDNPVQPATPFESTNQFRLLDTYVAGNFDGWNLAFGKQSLWWGPGDGGALLFSDNTEPIYMFRGSRVTPFSIPLLSDFLGPFKLDFFIGKLSDNEFPPRPLIHGEKISFKPTRGLEIGFDRTVEFGGVGRAMTAGAIWNSYVSVTSSVNYRASANPGKRTSGFDVSYEVPFVHNLLKIYADSLGADDVTPLANPPRAAWDAGLYMPRIPRIPKLDLRVEAGYTDPPTPRSNNGEFVYWDLYYHDLSTNKGNIIGSWMGREGKGVQAWTTYWFNSRSSLQFGYRNAKVAKDFIPSGETVNDGSVKFDWWLHSDLSLSASVQYEKWLAPILAPGPQTNWTSTIQIAFYPHSWTW